MAAYHRPPPRRSPRRTVHQTARRRDSGGRRMVQLVICGGIFVLLAAWKLLSPQSIAPFARTAGGLLGQDADFRAAFSAVGRAIAGQSPVSDSLQEAYTAVFAPSRYEAERAAQVQKGAMAAADRLHAVMAAHPMVTQPPPEEDEGTVTQSYTFFSQPLPEKVTMAQEIFPFAHTTPLQGTLTSTFRWREHPIYGGERFHYGIDIAGTKGSAIGAFAGGVVKAVGEGASLGKYLMIDHEGGITTLYAHCSKISVSSGQTVAMGEKVAEVGDTGDATGPHLHFEIHRDGMYLNPIYYVEVH